MGACSSKKKATITLQRIPAQKFIDIDQIILKKQMMKQMSQEHLNGLAQNSDTVTTTPFVRKSQY